jgi:hypothetical protein
MRYLAVMAFVSLVGCSALERADILQDAANYTGAPAGATGVQVIGEAASDIGSKVATGDYVGVILYIMGGIAAIFGGGWATKKFIQKKYARPRP